MDRVEKLLLKAVPRLEKGDAKAAKLRERIIKLGRVLWKKSISGHFKGDGPALSKRALVFTTQNRVIQAYEPSTGRRLWSRNMGTTHLSSPAIAGRFALFGSRTKLIVVEASTGDDVWELDLDGEVASPLVANESVYALAGGKLVAVR